MKRKKAKLNSRRNRNTKMRVVKLNVKTKKCRKTPRNTKRKGMTMLPVPTITTLKVTMRVKAGVQPIQAGRSKLERTTTSQ